MVLGTLSMLLRESLFSEERVCCQTGRQLFSSPSPVTLTQDLWCFFVTQSSGMLSEPEPPACLLYPTAGGQMCRKAGKAQLGLTPLRLLTHGAAHCHRWASCVLAAVAWSQSFGILHFWFSNLQYQFLTPYMTSARGLCKSLQYPHHTLPWQHWFNNFSWFQQNQDPVIATCQFY